MGWPRKNEIMRIYRERDGGYIFLNVADGPNIWGRYDAIVNVHAGPRPSLCSGGVCMDYIRQNWLKRVQWSDLPEEWQSAFRPWLHADSLAPDQIRGFWKVRNEPSTLATCGVYMERLGRGVKPCNNH